MCHKVYVTTEKFPQGGKRNYLLKEPQDGVTLQVRDILLQISLLLSLISYPVQHLNKTLVTITDMQVT